FACGYGFMSSATGGKRGVGKPSSDVRMRQYNGESADRISSAAVRAFSIRYLNSSRDPSSSVRGHKKVTCDHRSWREFGTGVPDKITRRVASGASERTASDHLPPIS